jgi:NADH-quinone oxidoreductase subunit J
MERVVFDLAALLAVAFAGVMVVHRNPIKSVLALVVSFFALAVCYVLLSAPFIAAIQVIVYAGAILVLFLFVIMLLNLNEEARQKVTRPVHQMLSGIGVLAFAALLLGVLRQSGQVRVSAPPLAAASGEVAPLARSLFADYLLPFEALSVLLLAALVGSFVLARRDAVAERK